MSTLFCTFILLFIFCESTWVKDLNLPRQLLEYHISSNKNLRERCSKDSTCKINLNVSKCFGFEKDCTKENSLGFRSKFTSCDNNLNPKVAEKFYEQGDFGYLESRLVKHNICSSQDSVSIALVPD
ncbi:hypothetical protein B9Z55_020451 [Caenorhabditis nigoni]|uniref:DUF19 domain-containing protein n=1 Tax=Caenorhabditis nigoni TaxID=1611254 RepID=A0A2G5TMW2_9PELO|nr:hypothetical protein B9Z55_020451 [Caenorhabditis nigoni]